VSLFPELMNNLANFAINSKIIMKRAITKILRANTPCWVGFVPTNASIPD
jgi:hypothetical protein